MIVPYLNSLLNDHVPSRTLRLSSTPRLIVPRTRTELAKRAFSVAAPALWNSLPVDVVDANSFLSLKKLIYSNAPTTRNPSAKRLLNVREHMALYKS